MHGAECGPAEQRALVRRVAGVERNAAAPEQAIDHPHAAHPARGVQRRPAVDAGPGRIEAEPQHQVGRVEELVEDRVRQVRPCW